MYEQYTDKQIVEMLIPKKVTEHWVPATRDNVKRGNIENKKENLQKRGFK